MNRKIEIVEHNPNWAKQFKEESKKIKGIFKKNCLLIQHIGSTAIKGLKADAVIDIIVILKDISKVIEHQEELAQLGYDCQEQNIYTKYGENVSYRLYLFADREKEKTGRLLAVREYFRANPELAKEYGELKETLAEAYPYDYEAYGKGKEEFLNEVEKKAVAWSEKEMQRSNYISMGMCMGLAIGTALGSAMGNLTIGMCIGLSLGLAIGNIIGAQKIKE